MEDVFKTLDLSDDNENFRGYTTMIELYNALKFITMLLFIQKISRFNLGVAFLKSVSICYLRLTRTEVFNPQCKYWFIFCHRELLFMNAK